MESLGIDHDSYTDPHELWLALYAAAGDRVTLLERYQMQAAWRDVSVAELPQADRDAIRHQVLPVLFPEWTEAKLPTSPDPIIVTDYDPDWPHRFAAIADCLRTNLAGLDHEIEHIGSTSVPGLAAKPIIDVCLAVPDCADEDAYVELVERCGVTLRSRDEGHRYFRPQPPRPRIVQVHVVDMGGDWVRRHLLFRDYLRAHPEAAAAYGELKRELAITYREDRLAYTAAKTNFILDELEKAEIWAAAPS